MTTETIWTIEYIVGVGAMGWGWTRDMPRLEAFGSALWVLGIVFALVGA